MGAHGKCRAQVCDGGLRAEPPAGPGATEAESLKCLPIVKPNNGCENANTV